MKHKTYLQGGVFSRPSKPFFNPKRLFLDTGAVTRMSFRTTMLRIARYSAYAVPIGVAIFIASMLLIAGSAEPWVGNKIVRGYVYDSTGTPIENAFVTVQIKDGATVKATLTDTTNETGFYSVTFAPGDGVVGDTIFVNATYDMNYNTNSTIATSSQDQPIQFVNVTLGIVIPEFGSIASLILIIFGAAAIFTVMSRKKG